RLQLDGLDIHQLLSKYFLDCIHSLFNFAAKVQNNSYLLFLIDYFFVPLQRNSRGAASWRLR
ncbi:MAG: hypothetical protein IJ551_05635, partial [Prevotella sp.]|nr:hypothetical protein [Prevotella sp.]